MNKNIGIILGVVALAVVVGGVYSSMNKKDEMMVKENIDKKMMEEKEVMMKDDKMKEETTMMKKEESPEMMLAGSYEEYSADKIARAETGDVVLFFHASWCPSCRGLNSNIESNLSLIPKDLTILKVDYDKEVELKKKYGVTTQHTLVQIDKDGNMLNKWSGGSTVDKIISQIK